MVKVLAVVVILLGGSIAFWQGAEMLVLRKSSTEESCGTRPTFRRSKRVVTGSKALPGQWPWHVLVMRTNLVPCAGVLVDEQWVFTVGHCVYIPYLDHRRNMNASNFKIIAGTLTDGFSSKVEEHSQERAVESVYLHPRYPAEHKINNYDIALIKLKEPFTFNNYVQPICLPHPAVSFDAGTNCFVAGWGKHRHKDSNTQFGPILLYAPVELRTPSVCKEFAGNVSKDMLVMWTDQKICGGVWDTHWKGPCKGDSGGGLVCEDPDSKHWYLQGLVSHGPKCGEIGYYTKMAAVMDFANFVMGGTNDSEVYSPSQIFSDYFTCTDENRTMIRIEKCCDGIGDCDDFSDESECICSDRQFRCPNGVCRMNSDRCNLVNDCLDGSDEEGCEYFVCNKSGKVIPQQKVCNSDMDCIIAKEAVVDESDENDCLCPDRQFRCPDGVCRMTSDRCNVVNDCLNGSDEEGCEYFVCNKSGKVIPQQNVCNSDKDCSIEKEVVVDFSDEIDCPCNPESQFRCPSGICIPMSWTCDGEEDCWVEEDRLSLDEANCEDCPPDTHFRCMNGRCIENAFLCDGFIDCGGRDKGDEENCETHNCPDGTNFCWPIGMCIGSTFTLCPVHRFFEICSDKSISAGEFLSECFRLNSEQLDST